MHLPNFNGAIGPDAAEACLEEVTRILEFLDVSVGHKVKIATFQYI